jgi:di/tricarboxylate transporter
MSFAVSTVIALVVAFAIGAIFDINIGLLALAAGYLVCVLFGDGTGDMLIAAVPQEYFILIVGILFLFAIATKNGTIEKLCNKILKLVKGNRILMPFAFALTGTLLSGLGSPGMSTAGLLASPVSTMAKKTKMDPVLLSVAALHGSFAGQYSPIASMGVGLIALLAYMEVKIIGLPIKVAVWNFVIQFILVVIAFVVFGGLKFIKESKNKGGSFAVDLENIGDSKFNVANWITIASIGLLVVNVFTLNLNIGIVGFVLGIINCLFSKKDGLADSAIIKIVPWNSIILLIGTMSLIGLMEAAGGMELIAKAIESLNLGIFSVLLFIMLTGLISYFSMSGPVLLAMVPLTVKYCATIGRPELIAGSIIAICIAGIMVDASPLSNSGSLFVASNAALYEDASISQKVFKKMAGWGLFVMAFGSLLSWLLMVVLRIGG